VTYSLGKTFFWQERVQEEDILSKLKTVFSAQVMEKGNGYLSLGFKGLELQETSCHSLEATRLDDIFDAAFEKRTPLNTFLFHSLTPLTTLEVVLYVESRSLVTEVLASPRTVDLVAESFVEALLWLLVDYAKKHREGGGERGEGRPVISSDVVVAIDTSSTGMKT
jgi:hypothetical protein